MAILDSRILRQVTRRVPTPATPKVPTPTPTPVQPRKVLDLSSRQATTPLGKAEEALKEKVRPVTKRVEEFVREDPSILIPGRGAGGLGLSALRRFGTRQLIPRITSRARQRVGEAISDIRGRRAQEKAIEAELKMVERERILLKQKGLSEPQIRAQVRLEMQKAKEAEQLTKRTVADLPIPRGVAAEQAFFIKTGAALGGLQGRLKDIVPDPTERRFVSQRLRDEHQRSLQESGRPLTRDEVVSVLNEAREEFQSR